MKSAKLQKPLTPFQILFLVPLALFILTSFIGEGLKLYRLSKERSAYSSLSDIDKLMEDLSMEEMFHKYGYDFRTKMTSDERRDSGMIGDFSLEQVIPKFFFSLTILLYPTFLLLRFIKEVLEKPKK
ncbi:hypothetical protein EHQ53_04920 [Leptospira langatensis]|uniref:Uncharacterized protein n=1 Tax=Leptospira langatensis TaxID=2484983 RepID=A0A5F1ZXR1_9LEPT|nr:hypothetical protein [Leptospira langatensis]TGK00158.1 hypothetical protein EHO57_12780 [Leptospira langatensis]TGL42793.1 hypothetical protein EHQ53_04920 [Leptospira langatensis]